MGNKPVKHLDTNCPSLSWDEKNNRQIYKDPKSVYVFNFYGEYSREEFLKANIDDPELERMLKEYVDERLEWLKVCDFQSMAIWLHHKDQKFGVAFFNKAYIDPLATITLSHNDGQGRELPQLRVFRYLGKKDLKIVLTSKPYNVYWKPVDIDITTSYICDLIAEQEISVVENDFGVQSVNVSNKDELREAIKKLIAYMLSIEKK